MATDPLSTYEKLQKVFSADVKSEKNQSFIGDIYRSSCKFLARAATQPLKSFVPGKEYFAFRMGKRLSRAVNQELFVSAPTEWEAFRAALAEKRRQAIDPDSATRIIYSVAVSFFGFIDLTTDGDQKTPGTFFEYLIGHLFAWRMNVN